MQTKLTDKRQAFFLFALCWAAYFTCYIGRLNYSSAMAVMIDEQVLTRTQAGTISMVYFFVYGTGQLLNGFLGDRLRPARMVFGGLFLSMLCNFAMSLAGSFGMMALLWGVNGYAQAMVWPPIIRLFATRMHESDRVRYSVDIVSSQAIGTLAAYVLAAGILSVSGWRTVFCAAGVCLLVMAAAWAAGFHSIERRAARSAACDEPDKSAADAPADAQPSSQSTPKKGGTRFTALLAAGLWMAVLPAMIHGVLKDGVTAWVPTYIAETFHTSASLSVLVTTLLPIVNLSGAYIARSLHRRCGGNEMRAAAVLFGAASLALAALWGAGAVSLALTVALLTIITSSMIGVNTLFVSLLPLRYHAEGRVSSVSGFLNACAYIGTAISTFTIGVMVERLGWGATTASWLAVTLAALLFCLALWRGYGARFTASK